MRKNFSLQIFLSFYLLFFISGCNSLKPELEKISACPVIPNPLEKAEKPAPFSVQMKTVLRFKKESFSMIQILSADPENNFYHCQMMTPFGVKCLEFTRRSDHLSCDYIFPAMEKMNRNNRLVLLLSEAFEKIFQTGEMEKAVFYETPDSNTGILTRGKETLWLKIEPASGRIMEKNYFIRGKNVVNISFLNNTRSGEHPFSGTVRYSHLKSGLTMDLKRIPCEHDQ